MKKIFSFALVAVMVASMFSFVACKKQNEPEKIETPTVLTGTTWINGEGTDWVETLIFNTENKGVKKVDNEFGHFEGDITYTYANGAGSFIWEEDQYNFTVDGNKLSVPDKDDPNPDFAMVYLLKK